jgi:cytochrome c oxidase subunit 3
MNKIQSAAPGGVMKQRGDYTASKVGMWLFIFTEILLFGGLFLLYSVYRTMHPGEFHLGAAGLSIPTGAINTVILLTSSLAVALAISALQKGEKRASLLFQALTILLGASFLVNKYFEWGAKIRHGIYPEGPELLVRSHGENLFYGLYYVMTGLHGLHVLAGLVLLSLMLISTIRGRINSRDFVRLENSGLYWHLVDVIWIYLFPLFYLIT